MLHVDIRCFSNLSHSLLLLLGLGRPAGGDLSGIFACRLLSNADQFAMHILNTGELDARPHSLKLGLYCVIQRRVVQPDALGQIVLLGAIHQDLMLGLKVCEGLFAIGPAVLEVFDGYA